MEQWNNQGERAFRHQLCRHITPIIWVINTETSLPWRVILTLKQVRTMSLGKCSWLADAGHWHNHTHSGEREEILNIFILGVWTIEAPANLMETPFPVATYFCHLMQHIFTFIRGTISRALPYKTWMFCFVHIQIKGTRLGSIVGWARGGSAVCITNDADIIGFVLDIRAEHNRIPASGATPHK